MGKEANAASKYEISARLLCTLLQTISCARIPIAATSRTRHESGEGINGPDIMRKYCSENPGRRIGYQIWMCSENEARALRIEYSDQFHTQNEDLYEETAYLTAC